MHNVLVPSVIADVLKIITYYKLAVCIALPSKRSLLYFGSLESRSQPLKSLTIIFVTSVTFSKTQETGATLSRGVVAQVENKANF